MRAKSLGKRIEITDRDIEIFRLLMRYRYLRSTYLYAFLGGNRTRFIERLGHLYHEGYLERPEQQWQIANCRSMPAVYELGRAGERALQTSLGLTESAQPAARRHSRNVRQFDHQLLVCGIIASLELATLRHPDLRFIGEQEILVRAPHNTRTLTNTLSIQASFSYSDRKSVV